MFIQINAESHQKHRNGLPCRGQNNLLMELICVNSMRLLTIDVKESHYFKVATYLITALENTR